MASHDFQKALPSGRKSPEPRASLFVSHWDRPAPSSRLALGSGSVARDIPEYFNSLVGKDGVERLLRFIDLADLARGAILRISPAFRFRVIAADPDDNKFADCAIAAGADFILTSDRHFDALNGAGYKPIPIRPEEFILRYLPPQ